MNFACSLAWRLLLAVALIANPLIGMGGSAQAKSKAAAATQTQPCSQMRMGGDQSVKPHGSVATHKAACHDQRCPNSSCGSSCDMGTCVGHCVYLAGTAALPVWRDADAQLPLTVVQAAPPPMLAPLIRPPIA
jgi:hypothetical protein